MNQRCFMHFSLIMPSLRSYLSRLVRRRWLLIGTAVVALGAAGWWLLGSNPMSHQVSTATGAKTMETATFAGGCFWCMQPPFEKLPGVSQVLAGYAGGTGADPTYSDYAEKGYVEAVQIRYDPSQISYSALLNVFWRQIDPTDAGGQFVDRGPQYRSVIFYDNERQRRLAEKSKADLAASGRFSQPIVTEIVRATTFTRAEEYHQDYHSKNPIRYSYYRWHSGRDQFLDNAWGADRTVTISRPPQTSAAHPYPTFSKEELSKKLTPLQYQVTQENATEPAFHNAYWNNHREGIYVHIVSREPLFSSADNFDSGTGWPSFTKPLEPNNIVDRPDRSWFWTRTEVRSAHANSHLGDVFHDGPPPTGLRYCINSAALRFIPNPTLVKEGYGQYLHNTGD